ncbi:hypothetical protein FIBSPDRAFT_1054022 [Athelia psychrophila]|uniref:DUF6533 domain-containing protein n=1 Tax=Athelia psychrophila TaxID=1759441 RepID=A0A167W0U0_9AGAM|nr:hypothetical protein FIBSPDRAFT_1054022 [Fibularhizoctonia sp. CBS 109695]
MSGSSAVVSTALGARIVGYLYTSNLVMYAYDWLLSISEEVAIVSQGSLTWSIAIYFLSRASHLVFLLLALTFYKANWVNCTALFACIIITSSMAITSTSFLFFLRVRAVYLQSRTITILFGALWVVTQERRDTLSGVHREVYGPTTCSAPQSVQSPSSASLSRARVNSTTPCLDEDRP